MATLGTSEHNEGWPDCKEKVKNIYKYLQDLELYAEGLSAAAKKTSIGWEELRKRKNQVYSARVFSQAFIASGDMLDSLVKDLEEAVPNSTSTTAPNEEEGYIIQQIHKVSSALFFIAQRMFPASSLSTPGESLHSDMPSLVTKIETRLDLFQQLDRDLEERFRKGKSIKVYTAREALRKIQTNEKPFKTMYTEGQTEWHMMLPHFRSYCWRLSDRGGVPLKEHVHYEDMDPLDLINASLNFSSISADTHEYSNFYSTARSDASISAKSDLSVTSSMAHIEQEMKDFQTAQWLDKLLEPAMDYLWTKTISVDDEEKLEALRESIRSSARSFLLKDTEQGLADLASSFLSKYSTMATSRCLTRLKATALLICFAPFHVTVPDYGSTEASYELPIR